MNAIVVAVLVLVAFFLSYRFYAGFLSRRTASLDPGMEAPSHALEDGLDYVLTRRSVPFRP